MSAVGGEPVMHNWLATMGVAVICSASVCVGQGICQTARITASDRDRFDSFGRDVAISNETALIGTFWDDDNGVDSGSAYLFRFDGKAWVQTQKLVASDGTNDNWFGRAVAIDGDKALIGAMQHLHSGANGSVYAFGFDGIDWCEQQELRASDGELGDGFGASVSISGDVAVIGALADSDNGGSAGSAYIFRLDAASEQWVEEQKLLAFDGASGDFFGISAVISGDVVVIGASGHDATCMGNQSSDSGAAYVFRFDHETSQWVHEQKLVASDCEQGDNAGEALALDGDVALLASRLDDENGTASGSAYSFRFDRDTSVWIESQKLLASDGQSGDQFGSSMAVSGNTALIGAKFADVGGAAYLFRHKNGAWLEEGKLLPDSGPFFGGSVALGGDIGLVGAHGEDTQRGAAYILEGVLDDGGCPWDLDTSGRVGTMDLLSLLATWGSNPGGPPDFDGDGIVGTADLLDLLANWGPCHSPCP